VVKPLDPQPIRTIVFDLDDTLRYNEPHAHAFISDFAETLRGRPLTPEERRAEMEKAGVDRSCLLLGDYGLRRPAVGAPVLG